MPLPGPLVKRLRHRPFTAVIWVRFPYGSPKRGTILLDCSSFFLFSVRESKGGSWRHAGGMPQPPWLCPQAKDSCTGHHIYWISGIVVLIPNPSGSTTSILPSPDGRNARHCSFWRSQKKMRRGTTAALPPEYSRTVLLSHSVHMTQSLESKTFKGFSYSLRCTSKYNFSHVCRCMQKTILHTGGVL